MPEHGTKTTPVFLPADGGSWSLLSSLVTLISGSTVQPENTIPVSSRWQVSSEKAKKGYASTLITTTTSVHLPKPVSTDLKTKPYSILTNPIGKNGVQSWSMQNIYPIRDFYCDTFTRRLTNQGWRGKTGPTRHQPSTSMPQGKGW